MSASPAMECWFPAYSDVAKSTARKCRPQTGNVADGPSRANVYFLDALAERWVSVKLAAIEESVGIAQVLSVLTPTEEIGARLIT